MIPGELIVEEGHIIINEGRKTRDIEVTNIGDRPIQVGSHFHFFEVNLGLIFDRQSAYGMRLDIPSGVAVRFEPGDSKMVTLVELKGKGIVYGLNNKVDGPLNQNGSSK